MDQITTNDAIRLPVAVVPWRRAFLRGIRWFLAAGFIFYIGLFAYNSLTRTRLFTIDSLIYIDVARNLGRGAGLVQSILVIDEPLTLNGKPDTLTPFTIQAPLYPILITLGSLPGIPDANAALLISVVAMAFILLFSYKLARDLYDEPTAWLALCLLILGPNLEYVTRLAWSEASGMAWMMLSLWLLEREFRSAPGKHSLAIAVGAGLAAGLAFATRYALIPLVAVGLGVLIFERRRLKSLWLEAGLFLLGWLLPAGLVFAHNILSIQRLLPGTLPSERNLFTSLGDAVNALFGNYISLSLSSELHYGLLAVFILCIWLIAFRQGRARRYFLEMIIRGRRYLLVLWPAIYLAFLLYQRGVSHFDELDLRLVAPASLTLVILVTGLSVGLLRPRDRIGKPAPWLMVLAGVLVLLACAREIVLATTPPAQDFTEQIIASPKLSWIERNVGDRDLILGDNTGYIPFYFNHRAVISFSPFPYTIQLTQAALIEFIQQNCGRFDNFYLILGQPLGSQQKHRQQFGEFIGRLIHGKMKGYPGVEMLAESAEGFIYRLNYCQQD